MLSSGVDGIFTLGDGFRHAVENFHGAAAVERLQSFSTHQSLAEGLKKFIRPNDIVLIKGSRGMQMEKILAYL
jgi:UDP-N-acetylmuramoyl-tripeptide--D-alanyl-D-alanine ligase